MPRYNLAYRPDDIAFETACIASAQKHFSALAEGYLLTIGAALPHVTVFQFESDAAVLPGLWEDIRALGKPDIELVLNAAYIIPGEGKHEGFSWIGLEVTQAPSLLALRKTVSGLLGDRKVTIRPSSQGAYWPHLTFARLKKADAGKAGSHIPKEHASTTPRAFRLTIGLSDENGVYREQLYP